MPDLVFLDTETTGLEANKHDVWEIAWAVNDEPVRSEVLVHSLKMANPKSLDMNGYWSRHAGAMPRSDGPWIDLKIREILEGNTLVCANPTFDRMFLYARWGEEPYHYRSIDIESMAMLAFQWERPRGLKDIVEELRSKGYDVPFPDHSAARDVEATRAAYWAIRKENDRYKIY